MVLKKEFSWTHSHSCRSWSGGGKKTTPSIERACCSLRLEKRKRGSLSSVSGGRSSQRILTKRGNFIFNFLRGCTCYLRIRQKDFFSRRAQNHASEEGTSSSFGKKPVGPLRCKNLQDQGGGDPLVGKKNAYILCSHGES